MKKLVLLIATIFLISCESQKNTGGTSTSTTTSTSTSRYKKDTMKTKDIEEVVVVGYGESEASETSYERTYTKRSKVTAASTIKSADVVSGKASGLVIRGASSSTADAKIAESNLPKSGQLTAGEVNDFSKWNYWQDIAIPNLDAHKNEWKFFPDKRVSVQLVNKNSKPIIGKKLQLLDDKDHVIWESITDNLGKAEFWISAKLDDKSESKFFQLTDEKGNFLSRNVSEFHNGQNVITLDEKCLDKRNLELAFVVDATGSMSDEIQYLQSELLDVLQKTQEKLKNVDMKFGSVFYRDQGDDYVTKLFQFTQKPQELVDFIKLQNAGGGGDTPEDVVEALNVSVNQLKWSDENSTKIMFLILDAPPHNTPENITKLFNYVKLASKKGIMIIPLTASGIDKSTEYLMRSFALLTNGTYTFLTNDSGIGNSHIKPTTDKYDVEKLNDLLLRLIIQRTMVSNCESSKTEEIFSAKINGDLVAKKESEVKIYPNPTNGNLTIESSKNIDELEVFDFTGKLIIRKEKLSIKNYKLDLTKYPQSIYLLKVTSEAKSQMYKIIKD